MAKAPMQSGVIPGMVNAPVVKTPPGPKAPNGATSQPTSEINPYVGGKMPAPSQKNKL